MRLEHILSTKQFEDRAVLEEVFRIADAMEAAERERSIPQVCKGKILATVFYEPSTRTRFSFESAMHRLGGSVISSDNAGQFSSAIKGETIEDSIRVISGYADGIVIRHPQEGAARAAAGVSTVPVINAGDGAREHPTQAILDFYTIKKEIGRIDGLSVAFVGDLRHGRTVHSLLYLLGAFDHGRISLVSPPPLSLPDEYKEYLSKKGLAFVETEDLDSVAANADVLYVTRIQKERFPSAGEYEKLKGSYIVGPDMLARMKRKAIIMHPLPRVDEVSPEVDRDPRAAYFRQTKNGLYVRMALLAIIIGDNFA